MTEPEPLVTQRMKLTEARQHFSAVLMQVFRGETRVIVEKGGIPVAAIISLDDLQGLARMEQRRAEAFQALDRFGEAFKDESAEGIEREVAGAVASARRELRHEAKQRAAAS